MLEFRSESEENIAPDHTSNPTTGSRDYLPEEPSLTQPNHSFQCYIEERSSRYLIMSETSHM